MGRKWVENLIVEDAKLMFKNFSGKKDIYNGEGERSFNVVLRNTKEQPDLVDSLIEDGWAIKVREPRTPDEDFLYRLPVKVRFDKYPPEVYLVKGRKKELLDETTIGDLDKYRFTRVDLEINPSFWDINGKSGMTAYLRSGFFTVEESPFASRYADYEDAGVDDDYCPFD